MTSSLPYLHSSLPCWEQKIPWSKAWPQFAKCFFCLTPKQFWTLFGVYQLWWEWFQGAVHMQIFLFLNIWSSHFMHKCPCENMWNVLPAWSHRLMDLCLLLLAFSWSRFWSLAPVLLSFKTYFAYVHKALFKDLLNKVQNFKSHDLFPPLFELSARPMSQPLLVLDLDPTLHDSDLGVLPFRPHVFLICPP